MIRKLTKRDDEQVMKLVLPEASINLFIIGDIEMYGYEADFQELWGDFDKHHQLRGILLRYYEYFIVYGLEDYDAKGFANIIESHEKYDGISGKQGVLKLLQPYLKGNYCNRDSYFAACRKETLKVTDNPDFHMRIEIAGIKDAKKLAELMCSIKEFTVKDICAQTERAIKAIEDKAGRYYFIEEKGKAVSMVATAAENSKSAMLVGVCTAPEYRMKGYTTAIMSTMLQDLLAEKESVCLFYDNPQAASIYKRSGFVDIGMWTMLVNEYCTQIDNP